VIWPDRTPTSIRLGGVLEITPWTDRVKLIDAEYRGRESFQP
jgi:hypothetical protein